jgi:hypothetical protein
MTEQLLNLVWLSLAILAFAVVLPAVKTRRLHAAVALGALIALLFPIISISDDLYVDWSAQEVVAVLFAVAAFFVVLAAIARLIAVAQPRLIVAALELSDPRSPPRV